MTEPTTAEINPERIAELVAATKDYINDLLVCLENEDYEMLGAIDAEYSGLQAELEALPEGATEYYTEEWELIDAQLKDLRDIMEDRRDNLRYFIERSEQTGTAAKAYTRNMDFSKDGDLGDTSLDVVLQFPNSSSNSNSTQS